MFYFSNNLSFGERETPIPLFLSFLCSPFQISAHFHDVEVVIYEHTLWKENPAFFSYSLIHWQSTRQYYLTTKTVWFIFYQLINFPPSGGTTQSHKTLKKIVRKPCNQYDWDCPSSSKVPWIENSKGTHTVELKSMILAHTEIST